MLLMFSSRIKPASWKEANQLIGWRPPLLGLHDKLNDKCKVISRLHYVLCLMTCISAAKSLQTQTAQLLHVHRYHQHSPASKQMRTATTCKQFQQLLCMRYNGIALLLHMSVGIWHTSEGSYRPHGVALSSTCIGKSYTGKSCLTPALQGKHRASAMLLWHLAGASKVQHFMQAENAYDFWLAVR